MPNLIVFESVDDSRLNLAPSEDSVQVCWSEQPPALSQLVSMGGIDKRWQIVKLVSYAPMGLHPAVAEVYLAIVNREDLETPPEAEWYCNSHPQEAIHVMLSEVRSPELSLIWDCQNEPPKIGEPLLEGEDTGVSSTEFSTVVKLKPPVWFVDRFDTYLPQTKAPYSMYLAWCKARVLQVA